MKLANVYCETGLESGPNFVWWSANTIMRQAADAKDGPAFRMAAIVELVQIADNNAKEDKKRQKQMDLTRARALRAALYFTAPLDQKDIFWLSQQRDPGTDLLALRPKWLYAVPHPHVDDAD